MPLPCHINGRAIGPGHPCYIVAEISANHDRDLDRAIALVRAAKRAGADAVKLQTYTPDTLTIDSDQESFRIPDGGLWSGKTLYELYAEAYTPWEWHDTLFSVAREETLDWFSTPFDGSAVAFLETLNVPAYKIASFELVDIPLLREVAKTGKPVILSTGMGTLEDIELAVRTLRDGGAAEIVLLKCTSAYPAKPSSMNLRTLSFMAQKFDAVVGLSDHTLDVAVPVASVALGASMIEKHLTLSRAGGGVDATFSLEPAEFEMMVRCVRHAEEALGSVSFDLQPEEQRNQLFRRSLFVVRDVVAGELLTELSVRSIRPGYGLHPRHLDQVVGRRAATDIARGTPLSWKLVE
jgi:pseudaminic acid synthase